MNAVALLILLVGLLAHGLIVAYTLRTGISPMPTSSAAREALTKLLPRQLGGAVVELGAGWGGLSLFLARRYPRCRVLAYEISPLPWVVAAARRWLSGPSNLCLRRSDFFGADLADARLVVCYLCPAIMERLRPKLEAELRAGTVVVSNFFRVPGWSHEPPLVRAADGARSPVYRYRFPDCVGGDKRSNDSFGRTV